jgi:transglycosylase associated protein
LIGIPQMPALISGTRAGVTGFNLYSLVISIIGAIVVLAIYHAIIGRRVYGGTTMALCPPGRAHVSRCAAMNGPSYTAADAPDW